MKKYFITGLLVLVPLFITLWVLSTLIHTMDQSLLLLPRAWQPVNAFSFNVPGLGAILTLVIIFVTGLISTNIFGQQLIALWENFLSRVPFVKIDLFQCQTGFRHAFFRLRPCLPQGFVNPIPTPRQLDYRLPDGSAGR